MDFKKVFLELTKYTVPFGTEEEIVVPILKKYIPDLEKDSSGNYYVTIGNSDTLFTTHMDTYSKEIKKVNHVIKGNWISTDGTTILGGDNKNGTTILIYLIQNNIPGTYYFFIGEEPIISGGLYGSTIALKNNPEFFKKFKRAIAFDRKHMGSLVTRQLARKCCSTEFADALIKDFDSNGLEYFKDPTAYYTDTASFLNVIPEITNLSAGGWGEHTLKERTNIQYVEHIAIAASNIKWEELPSIRQPMVVTTKDISNKKHYSRKTARISNITFDKVNRLMSMLGFRCLNINEFEPNAYMLFSHWHRDSEIYIQINGDSIIANDQFIGNFNDFKKALNINNIEDYVDIDELLDDILRSDKKILNLRDVDDILDEYMIDYEELLDYIKRNKNLPISVENNKIIIKDDV